MQRTILLTVWAGVLLTGCRGSASAQPVNACESLRHHGKVAEAESCFTKQSQSPDPAQRAEGFWGLGRLKEANDAFSAAVKRSPKSAALRVRWGRLMLDGNNPSEAQKLFGEALELDEKNADAYLGLALVASNDYSSKAGEAAAQALKLNPKLVEAQELLARLALEDNDQEKAIAEADRALQMSPEALDAMAVRATIDWLRDKQDSPWMAKALQINPAYGEGYALIGHFFVINRRYEEGIGYYRKAVELQPKLWRAKAQLGVSLMQLGREEEARPLLQECYDNGFRNAMTTNSLTLMDSYKNFVTFRTPTTVLRLHKKEADLLRPYFEGELQRAIQTYNKKYKMTLSGPVQLEVYPDHEDFAVRTMGLPGLGALGVTFGNVVAMDSPSGRKPGSFHWDTTLWHELSHVYVLSATKHKVPRWFTEGMAVHEETAAAPDWGDRLDPQVIMALQKKALLPVAKLDRGFVRPSYPAQVIVSYFQAGRICDYINQKWGYDKLLAMMHSYATGKGTPEVIEQQLGVNPEEFDKQFLAWLGEQTKRPVEGFEEWQKRRRALIGLANSQKQDEVITEGAAIRDIYPDYVEDNSVYEIVARAYEAKGDKAAAVRELSRYSDVGGRSPAVLKKLAIWQEELGQKEQALTTLERINLVFLKDEEVHRRAGALAAALKKPQVAVREYRAALACGPVDAAAAHYNLAEAYRSAGQLNEAKDEVLQALEAAPGFKPAQRLLLELSQRGSTD